MLYVILRRHRDWQLAVVSSAPVLLFFPVGT